MIAHIASGRLWMTGIESASSMKTHTSLSEGTNHDSVREPNLSIFECLATNHGIQSSQPFRHPAFDLQNTSLVSFASNCTALIGWHSYEAYEKDMRALLEI